jgi:hypothetical protein
MNPDLPALFVAIAVFVSGLAGLAYQTWQPSNEQPDETRDLINRVTGLIATLAALVLGLLIASASSFYNNQKTSLELVSARVLALDGVLRRYGPDGDLARDQLRDLIISSYERVWGSSQSTLAVPTVEETNERMERLFLTLNGLRETAPEARKYLLAKAGDLATSINDQRLQMSLQLNNSLSWPFLTVLVSWACLLFFGFGMLAKLNRTTVLGLAVGAISVGSAIFLIVELNKPYSGLLTLSPAPILETMAALNQESHRAPPRRAAAE